MTRQELVARAFERLANPDADMRFLAVKDLKKALDTTEETEEYPNQSLKLLTALIEHADGLKFSPEAIYDSIGFYIHKKDNSWSVKKISRLIEYGYINNLDFDGLDFALQTIAESLVKAARYDAFVAKYQAMKERVQAGKEEILQVEQFFKAVDDSHLLGN